MRKFHLHSVTDVLEYQQQPYREDCCYVVMAKTVVDVPLLDLLQDILLLS